MQALDPFVSRTRIAYFSMEIALRPEMRTYAGGLGILAGDAARSCADLALPVVFVTLASRAGYLRQEIDAAGRQVDHPDPWDIAAWATPLPAMVSVEIERRAVWLRPWLHVVDRPHGTRVPVLLLDTDVEQNAPQDRRITERLYGGDEADRLRQEIVLGIGGVRALHALGFNIETWHLNEGHAALLAVPLLTRHPRERGEALPGMRYAIERVRECCVFTTHTPVEAGHDRFDWTLVGRLLGDAIEIEQLQRLAGADRLNMTRLALNVSGYVNGVAHRHAETAARMFPGHRIRAITNGVHPATWASAGFAALFDAIAPGWRHEPELLSRADQLDDGAVRTAHAQAKRALLDLVARAGGPALDPALPVLGFARRMTGYKRPDLLFTDLERLRALHRRTPFQLVMAGKAHPRDDSGKRLIEQVHAAMRSLADAIPMVFLPGYDMALAQRLVAGVDVWLNTPLPPLEASGTSGMKAALNGVLNLSTLDGWWLEGCIDGVTGWAVGRDGGGADAHAGELYRLLEGTVLPLFHHDPDRWTWMAKQSIAKIGATFHSQRMMRRYASEAYLR